MNEKKFTYSNNGCIFQFNISNENMATINLHGGRTYTPQTHNLIENLRRVRKQPLFGNIVSDNALEELTNSYPFRPFKYQVENVKAMLNRFEGKGVFGDQVGLGKTVEALMTAHAMFKSGAIRNALIVVPGNVERGWREEIARKFPDVFDVAEQDSKDDDDKLKRLVARIQEDNRKALRGNYGDRTEAKCRLYFLTELELKRKQGKILELQGKEEYINTLKENNSYDAEELADLKSELEALNPTAGNFKLIEILKRYGWVEDSEKIWDEDVNSVDELPVLGLLSDPSIPVYKKVVEVLEGLLERWRNNPAYARYRDQRGFINKLDTTEKIKEQLSAALKECEDFVNNNVDAEITELFNNPQHPMIDLLIVDEVHAFYSNSDDSEDDQIDDGRRDMVELLADISKKYCVLMSATPLRQNLEDVFDLLYIVDKKRFGATRAEAEEYFYGTVCGLTAPDNTEPDEDGDERKWDKVPFKLSQMFSADPQKGGNDRVYERTMAFFGLINNYFTRKRIKDVTADMTGILNATDLRIYAKELASHINQFSADVTPDNRNLRESILSGIKAETELICNQYYGANKQDVIVKEVGMIMGCARNGDSADLNEEQLAKLKAAACRTFSGMSEDGRYSVDQRRAFHSLVDWSRQKKMGFGLRATSLDGEQIDKSTLGTMEKLRTLADDMADVFTAANPKEIEKFFEENHFVFNRPQVETAESYETLRDPVTGETILEKMIQESQFREKDDALLCYVSRDTKHNYRGRIVMGLRQEYENRSVVNVASDIGSITHVTAKDHNRVVILHQGCQAGINLQQYCTFIFAQMDSQGKSLQEPVDVEQWVGRIHRTGQVKECLVITVISTFMSGNAKNISPEFLEWYYGVLADKDGLDLYGNSTPDVALLQPIVTDLLGNYLETISNGKDAKTFAEARAQAKLSDEKAKLKSLKFSQLLELCFVYDSVKGNRVLKTKVEEMIRDLLRKNKALGKIYLQNA